MSRSNAAAALLFRRKGDGSTLNLDFTGGSLDSRVVLTRSANTATYINSSGYVTTAVANEARFDYDPTTLAAKGLLIEGSAINLQRYSATFETTGSYWYQSLGTNAAGTAATAPDNTSTPRRLTEPASGTSTGQLQISGSGAGILTSTTYTVSFWAKAGSRSKVMWRCDGGGNDVGFNLSNGVATVVAGTFTTTQMTAYPNGWYRCAATWANVNAGGFPSIYLATGTGTTYTISYTCNSSYAELWGFQLEAGVGASSYIPTVASQVTRALDSCIMSGTSFSSWFNATQGTLLTTWSSTSIPSGRYATINDGSSSNQIWTGYSESAIYNGSFQASFGTATTANGKVAIAYALNDAAWCLSGGTVSTDTSVTLPTGLNQVTFGANPAGGAQVNTSLKTIKFFPTRLSSAQLIAMTT